MNLWADPSFRFVVKWLTIWGLSVVAVTYAVYGVVCWVR